MLFNSGSSCCYDSRLKTLGPYELVLLGNYNLRTFTMKTSVVCVIAFVALVNEIGGIHAKPNPSKSPLGTHNIEDLQICVPRTTKKEECNDCFCVEDGSGWACTRRGCSTAMIVNINDSIGQPSQNDALNRAVRDAPFNCVPNSAFKVDCNWCNCSPDGRSAACTLMGCKPSSYHLS